MRRNSVETLFRQGRTHIIYEQDKWEGTKKDFLFRKFKDVLPSETISKVYYDEAGMDFRTAMKILGDIAKKTPEQLRLKI